jgi:hypothetical protein
MVERELATVKVKHEKRSDEVMTLLFPVKRVQTACVCGWELLQNDI